MLYPTIPEWFAQLEPEDIVVRPLTGVGPRMADAEDGEDPGFDLLPPPGEDRDQEGAEDAAARASAA